MADEGRTFRYDVFLSHSVRDKTRVLRLAERLRAAGLRVWLDDWVIRPGDIISLKIEEGVEQSRVLLLCISPEALDSGWMALERSTAIHRDPRNGERRFVPVLIGDCELPETLAKYAYIDLREESEAAFEKVLVACRFGTKDLSTSRLPYVRKSAVQNYKTVMSRPEANPMTSLVCKLTGHRSWVVCVAVSQDGKFTATGSRDRTVKIWDLHTGKCKNTAIGHTGAVTCIAITPGNDKVLSGSLDRTVRIWDAHTGKELGRLTGHTAEVRSVFALKERQALSVAEDGILRLGDLASCLCVKIITCGMGIANPIQSSAFYPDKNQLLIGLKDGTISLWSLDSVECLWTIKGHYAAVLSVRFTRDGKFVISGSEDATVKIWNLDTKTCVGTLEGHERGAWLSVDVSPDGALIASTGNKDRTIRIWHRNSGKCLQIIPNRACPISVAFGSDGSKLIVGAIKAAATYVYRLRDINLLGENFESRRYVNAKVVLIGEGTVGKTSLAHRLIEDQYVVRDRTHGMNVWRLELPLQSNASLEREVLLWDLAGQEDYRLIHQLFLDETALALLLVNPQKDDPFLEAGEWLKALKTAANNLETKRAAESLLVFTHIDVGGMKFGSAKIDRFCGQYGLIGWIPTSAKTGENCSDGNEKIPSRLKQLIAESIPWDRLPWTSTD